MTRDKPEPGAPARELERIIDRMQRIQRTIGASRQPASMLELEELKALGREYARIIDRMADERDEGGLA